MKTLVTTVSRKVRARLFPRRFFVKAGGSNSGADIRKSCKVRAFFFVFVGGGGGIVQFNINNHVVIVFVDPWTYLTESGIA